MTRNRLVILIVAVLAIVGVVLLADDAAATPPASTTQVQQVTALPSGNGTSNFYLTGSCHAGTQPFGVDFWASNYDNGANQTYHTAWSRSGVIYVVDGIYIDGVYKGKGSDMFINIAGHGRHTLKLVMHSSLGGTKQSCSFTL